MHPSPGGRRRALATLGVAAVIAGACLASIGATAIPAAAATYGNTCTLPAALSPLPFQLSPAINGVPSVAPDADADGIAEVGADTVSVGSLTADIFVPDSIIEAGVALGIVQPGANLSGTVALSVAASNADPASRQVQATGVTLGTVTGEFVDGNGDLSYDDPEDTVNADPISSTIAFPGTAEFTPTGGEILLREEALVIVVNVGFNVAITCTPGYTDPGPDGELNDDPDTPGDETADNGDFIEQTDPFATVTVADTGSSSTGSTSSTSSSTSSTTSSTSSTSTTEPTTTTDSTTTTTAPPVQYYLPEGRVDVALECVGADAATTNLLKTLGDGTIELTAKVTTPAVTSPAKGESFDMSFAWQLGLDPAVIDTAEALGVGDITVSGAKLTVSPGEGVDGSDVVGTPAARSLTLAQAVSYSEGPFTGSFIRTNEIGEAITFTVKPVTMTAAVALSGAALNMNLACSPTGPSTLSISDLEGTPPPSTTSTTSTTEPEPEVLAETTSGTLPNTGYAPWGLLLIAVGSIDLGYLALTASRPRRPA